jgi:hypothetical protein
VKVRWCHPAFVPRGTTAFQPRSIGSSPSPNHPLADMDTAATLSA